MRRRELPRISKTVHTSIKQSVRGGRASFLHYSTNVSLTTEPPA